MTGASGCGTTTLARAVADAWAVVDALSGDVDVVVVVDLVKAAVQLVLAVEAEDALAAAHRALGSLDSALATAALSAPASILTVEAEAIPSPSQDHPLRPHPARGREGES